MSNFSSVDCHIEVLAWLGGCDEGKYILKMATGMHGCFKLKIQPCTSFYQLLVLLFFFLAAFLWTHIRYHSNSNVVWLFEHPEVDNAGVILLFVCYWEPQWAEMITLPVGRTDHQRIRFSCISDVLCILQAVTAVMPNVWLSLSYFPPAFSISSKAMVEVLWWRADYRGGWRLRCDAFLPRWWTGALGGCWFSDSPGWLLFVTQRHLRYNYVKYN